MEQSSIEQFSSTDRAISDLSSQSLEQNYLQKSKGIPRMKPLSRQEMRATVRRGDYVSGVVAVDLGEIIDYDHEWLLNECSALLTGSELLMDISFKVVGHHGDTLWLRVSGDASEVVRADDAFYSLEEMVVFSQDEADAILAASQQSPWMDRGINEAAGVGYVLLATYLDGLPEGVVIVDSAQGSRRRGLFIDGPLSNETLQLFQDILAGQRTWRAWPDSDFALVVPDIAYVYPGDDPLIAQLTQAVPLEEVFHTLEDLKLTFVTLYEGYLIVQNELGEFQTWSMLPDGRGIDEDISQYFPVLEYRGDLYGYGKTYSTREETDSAIRYEIGK